MSITIKKVVFGNANPPFILPHNFMMSAKTNVVNNRQATQPQMPQPVNTVPAQQVVVAPQPQYVTTTAPIPVYNTAPSNSNHTDNNKMLAYVASGLALVSLGVTGVNVMRGRAAKSSTEAAEKLEQRMVRMLEDKLSTVEQRTGNLVDSIENKLTKEVADREGLGHYFDGIIGDIHKRLGNAEKAASEKAPSVIIENGGVTNFLTRTVTVNGNKLKLANTLHGYGAYTESLENALRAESTNRMFGLVDRSNIVPKDHITVRVPTSEFNGIAKTGGLADVPREVIANLGAFINNKQDVRLIVDMPMYLGEVLNKTEKGIVSSDYHALNSLGNGKYDLVAKYAQKDGSDKIIVGNLEKVADAKIPVYTDSERVVQDVEVYIGRGLKQKVDYNLMKQYLTPEDLGEIEQALANNATYKKNILEISKGKDGTINAEIVFDGMFYKNEKFDMKGPRFNSEAKNIYNNTTINAGEAERFTYFDKYFYEFLIKHHEYTNENLGADLIIGNDWHTGGITAMVRLLTKAKEAVGDITAKEAEQLANTPVVTILHNAKEAGRSAHSNAKLFNIMFGEHASMIAPNAHMPDVSKIAAELAKKENLSGDAANAYISKVVNEVGLPQKCWNGLMHNGAVDPQAMATAYSDVLIPVSDKYMEEIATQGVYGRENFELFRLRKFATDHAKDLKGQKTIVGITNGSDRVNNVLTEAGARKLESDLGLAKNSLRTYTKGCNILEVHNHNKQIIIDKVIADVNDPKNPMKLSLPELTDLTGVTPDTMIVSTAGRIVDQKGLDIFAEAIEEFLRMNKGKFADGNYPVFYAQGDGDLKFVQKLLEIKQKVADSPELGGRAAANRIVFANLFKEAGRYDACKQMSDFSIMSSWFEPCGLVHKQIAANSGAIPIVNETGGLTSGLTDGVDAIFSKFKPEDPSKEAVIGENKVYFAEAMTKAFELFNNKEEFTKVLTNSLNNDFSWLVKGGPMEQYIRIFTDLKVLKPQIIGQAA